MRIANHSSFLWSRRQCLASLLGVSSLAGCVRRRTYNPSGHSKTVIQNAGSDTIVNLAQAWAEEYAQIEPSISVEVSGGGSGTGIAALINGTADIANSSRKIESKESELALAKTGLPPKQYIVGYDALAVYVHRDNPLEELTIQQIGDIYREQGPYQKWSQLGVQNTACRKDRIIRVSRQSNSGTYHYFRDAVLGKNADFKLGSLDLHGSKDVVELIARTPCAIGYSGMGYAQEGVKMIRVAKSAGEPAQAPTLEAAQNGTYPITRPLYLYTAGEPKAHVKAFMDWIFSDAGQQLVKESGFVPVRPISGG